MLSSQQLEQLHIVHHLGRLLESVALLHPDEQPEKFQQTLQYYFSTVKLIEVILTVSGTLDDRALIQQALEEFDEMRVTLREHNPALLEEVRARLVQLSLESNNLFVDFK